MAPAIIPTQITAVPRAKPNSAPAPVDTMLDGTGRMMSSARKLLTRAAAGQPARSPRIMLAPSRSN